MNKQLPTLCPWCGRATSEGVCYPCDESGLNGGLPDSQLSPQSKPVPNLPEPVPVAVILGVADILGIIQDRETNLRKRNADIQDALIRVYKAGIRQGYNEAAERSGTMLELIKKVVAIYDDPDWGCPTEQSRTWESLRKLIPEKEQITTPCPPLCKCEGNHA